MNACAPNRKLSVGFILGGVARSLGLEKQTEQSSRLSKATSPMLLGADLKPFRGKLVNLLVIIIPYPCRYVEILLVL